jgi:hypothetical protein
MKEASTSTLSSVFFKSHLSRQTSAGIRTSRNSENSRRCDRLTYVRQARDPARHELDRVLEFVTGILRGIANFTRGVVDRLAGRLEWFYILITCD